ncbi:MAG: RNA polymerase sigma factor [Myxococcaceae bacterium]
MLQNADIEGFYRRYGPMVYRRCVRFLGEGSLAEDALHDTFVRAMSHGKLQAAREPAAYLNVIATHVCLSRIRASKLRPTASDDSLLFELAHDNTLEARTAAGRMLERVFAGEAASTRTLAVLHLVDRMSLEDVADEVGLSVSGVRFRLRKLRQKVVDLEAQS